jgi:hypothetical protein
MYKTPFCYYYYSRIFSTYFPEDGQTLLAFIRKALLLRLVTPSVEMVAGLVSSNVPRSRQHLYLSSPVVINFKQIRTSSTNSSVFLCEIVGHYRGACSLMTIVAGINKAELFLLENSALSNIFLC